MPKKRRNNGRNRSNRTSSEPVQCTNCFRMVGKDKAVKRYQVRNIVDASSKKDIADASAYDEYALPKFYLKVQYCVACAIHARIVRVRQGQQRKVRFTTCKRLTAEEKEEQIRLARKRLLNQRKAAEEKANAAESEAVKVAEAVAQA